MISNTFPYKILKNQNNKLYRVGPPQQEALLCTHFPSVPGNDSWKQAIIQSKASCWGGLTLYTLFLWDFCFQRNLPKKINDSYEITKIR